MSDKDERLITLEALSEKHSTLFSECVDLYSEPTYRLLNKDSNQEFALSQDMLNLMMRHWNIELEIRHKQELLRRAKYNPILRFPSLSYPIDITGERDANPGQVYFVLTYLDTGTPTLLWGEELYNRGGKPNHNKLGWRLTLYGYEKANLGFAEWDALDGIDILVRMLFNRSQLHVLFALLDPDGAKEMTRIIEEEQTE